MSIHDQLRLKECQYELQLVEEEEVLFQAKRELRRKQAEEADSTVILLLTQKVNQADARVLNTETALFHLRRKIREAANY